MTQDLLGKLPDANKSYLEQMLFASYCSGLQADMSLSEKDKAVLIREYAREVRKSLYGSASQKSPPSRPQPQQPRSEEARDHLAKMSVPYSSDAFIQSAKNGDAYVVNLFIVAGMDPDASDREGNTALMYASKSGYKQVIDVLLNAGAKVNKANGAGKSAVSWAAAGDLTSLSRLIQAGADAVAINEALRSALWRGRDLADTPEQLRYRSATYDETQLTQIVSLLLDRGADVNGRDKAGWTPLLSAALGGYASVVQTLVDRGADVNTKCTCDQYAGWTALMLAAERNDLSVTKVLLARKADVNQRSNNGRSALLLAIDHPRSSCSDVAKALLNKGELDTNIADDRGKTALMPAAGYGQSDCVNLLLDHGANVNAKDKYESTSLMEAAGRGELNSVRQLLDHGADVNATDYHGRTALMAAVRDYALKDDNGPAVVALLLQRGADVNREDDEGNSALDVVQRWWGRQYDPVEQRRITEVSRLLEAARQANDVRSRIDVR